ncbi:serine/threonine-protein kinase [Streptomyces hydrogenans]
MEQLRLEDPVAVGPYRLLGRLGEGGMGEVFLAESAGGRRLAVKVVRPQYAAEPGFRRRFRREVDAARAVGGFWTAPVVDADPEAAAPWVASAYIDAPDLGRLVERDGPLDGAELRRLATGLAEALDAVHRAGLVHRDLKPANVLVTGDGPRVIDFGISKALEGATALTGTGLVVGTPGFMSPEQATGEEVGPASDLFALGAVLVYAATEEGPFGTGSAPTLLYRIVHEPPRLDGVPDALRGLVARCLEKEPGRRPSAAELLGALGVVGGAGGRGSGEDHTVVEEPDGSVAAPRPQEAGEGGTPEVVCKQALGRGRVTLMVVVALLTLFCGVGAVVTESPVDVMFGVPGFILMFVCAVGVPRMVYTRVTAVWVDDEGLAVTVGSQRWRVGWRVVRAVSLSPGGDDGRVWHLTVALDRSAAAHVPSGWRGRDDAEHVRLALVFPDAQVARVQLRSLSSVLVHRAAPGYVPDPSLRG